MSLTRSALVLALLFPVGLTACGGRSNERTKPLRKTEWIRRADAICTFAKARRDAIPAAQDTEELVASTEKLLEVISKEMGDLAALRPEAAEEAEVDRLLAAARAQITVAEGLVPVSRSGDQARIDAYLASSRSKLEEARRLAAAFGLEACGADG